MKVLIGFLTGFMFAIFANEGDFQKLQSELEQTRQELIDCQKIPAPFITVAGTSPVIFKKSMKYKTRRYYD